MHVDSTREKPRPGSFRFARQIIGAAAFLALGGFGVGGCNEIVEEIRSNLPPPAQLGPFDSCTLDTDCSFGEIGGEIDELEDCPCLYGCPYLPLDKATIERRQSQYEAVCDPGQNGNGDDCGVDDCAPAPRPACIAGKCTAATSD